MPLVPGLLISGSCLAGYVYWRYTFRQVTAAMEMERAGGLDEARELLQAFLNNRNPLTYRGESKARCRLLLARLERKTGRYDAAVREADQLLSTSPSLGITLAALQVKADALAWAGELEQALPPAEKALQRAQSSRLTSFVPEIKGLLARILTWQGDLAQAREIAENLIAGGGPASLYGYLRLAEIDRVAGHFTDSAEWCRQLVERIRTQPPAAGRIQPEVWVALAHYHAARAAWLSTEPGLAAEWLDLPAAAQQLPRSELVGWWGLRAAAAAQSRETAAARDHLKAMRKAAKSSPGGYGARAWEHYYEAQVEMAAGHYEAAAGEAAEAIRSAPPQDALAEMFYCLGTCLEKAGKPGGAYICGARQPPGFYFTALCQEKLNSPAALKAD